MEHTIRQIFDVFKKNRQDVRLQWHMVDELVAAGKTDILYELGKALIQAYKENTVAPLWAIESIYEHMEETLACTPGTMYAQTLVNLFLLQLLRSRHYEKRSRRLVPLLVESQSMATLLKLIKQYQQNQACTEFLAILVQEMVLHGIACDRSALIGHFVAHLQNIAHPLAQLPLTLTPAEHLLPEIFTRKGWMALTQECSDFTQHATPLPIFEEEHMEVEEQHTPAEQQRIQAAVAPWTSAQREAGIFVFNHATPRLSEQALRSLPLYSLHGLHSPHHVLRELPPSVACSLIFAAAAHGSAYGGYGGAYGRLALWQTLAGLAGVSDTASIEERASVVERCRWFDVTLGNEWFDTDGWKLGLLALRPDGRTLAVLAATAID